MNISFEESHNHGNGKISIRVTEDEFVMLLAAELSQFNVLLDANAEILLSSTDACAVAAGLLRAAEIARSNSEYAE